MRLNNSTAAVGPRSIQRRRIASTAHAVFFPFDLFVTDQKLTFSSFAFSVTSQPPHQEDELSKLLSTIDRLNSGKQDDASAFPVLRIGDSVERGPDWKWGTQDQSGGIRRCAAASARDVLRSGSRPPAAKEPWLKLWTRRAGCLCTGRTELQRSTGTTAARMT